jgi:hypothetical protein
MASVLTVLVTTSKEKEKEKKERGVPTRDGPGSNRTSSIPAEIIYSCVRIMDRRCGPSSVRPCWGAREHCYVVFHYLCLAMDVREMYAEIRDRA